MYDWIGMLTEHPNRLSRIARCVNAVPRPVRLGGLWLSGWIAFRLSGNLRKRIVGNIGGILSDRERRETRRIARRYFVNLAITMYELLIEAPRLDERDDRRMELVGEHHLQQALRQGRGAIVYSPHMGNFFYYYWKLSRRYRCLSVATASSPELRPIYLTFRDLGCSGLDYDQTPPLALLRRLREHLASGGIVFLLGDFYRPTFPEATLFGRRTRSPGGAAMLALGDRVPIVPLYGRRLRRFAHRMELAAPIQLSEEYAGRPKAAAERLNGLLEDMIRKQPEQWFYWFSVHERWIGGEDAESPTS